MLDNKKTRRRLIRYALSGTLALGLVIISAKLIENITSHTNAQGVSVKDEQVTADEVPEAATEGSIEPLPETPDQVATITTYTVKPGDTLTSISKQFNISINTIYWANDLNSKSQIKVGQELVILPVSGIEYTVKKGDTLSGIVSRFGGDTNQVLDFNNLDDAKKIRPGMKLIIPGAELSLEETKKETQKPTMKPKTAAVMQNSASAVSENKSDDDTSKEVTGTNLVNPAPGSILTQGLHDINAVDFGEPIGSPVHSAAAGTVLIAKGDGHYNGGFGNYIVINHTDGTQTLYAHLSKVVVTPGQGIGQGDVIGKSGSTGKSTGPHLHFEVHGKKNPWAHDPVGTHY